LVWLRCVSVIYVILYLYLAASLGCMRRSVVRYVNKNELLYCEGPTEKRGNSRDSLYGYPVMGYTY
jgi:hypothetical protein